MDAETLRWVAGIGVVIVLALIGVIFGLIVKRQDSTSQDIRLHISEDSKAHERIAVIETKVDALDKNVTKLRDMRHEIIDEVSHKLAGWYLELLKVIKGEK